MIPYATTEFADEFFQAYAGGEKWGELSEEQKLGALNMASLAIEAGRYTFTEPPPEALRVATCIEALARGTNAGLRDARAMIGAGIASAAMGHASESYAKRAKPATLWDADAKALIEPYKRGSAPVTRGTRP